MKAWLREALIHEVVRRVALEEARLDACALAVAADDDAAAVARAADVLGRLHGVVLEDIAVHVHLRSRTEK